MDFFFATTVEVQSDKETLDSPERSEEDSSSKKVSFTFVSLTDLSNG